MAQNPNNGQTVIKSVYKKPNKQINGILDGRTHPSPALNYKGIDNHTHITRPAAARFSALQNTVKSNITPIRGGVKSVVDVLDGATLGGASKADKKYFGGTWLWWIKI